MTYALLAWFALQLVVSAWRAARQYATFKRLTTTEERQARYRRWFLQSLVLYSVIPTIALALIHRVGAIVTFPAELVIFHGELPRAISYGLAGGALGGITLGAIVTWKSKTTPPIVGDIAALLPRNGAERRYGALMSLGAGFGEELLFRLLVPLLMVSCGAPAIVAVIVSVAIFGLAHIYQGIGGVIGTSVLGAILAFVYLGSQSLWLAMLVHALLDLNVLVVRTWILERRAQADCPPSTSSDAPVT